MSATTIIAAAIAIIFWSLGAFLRRRPGPTGRERTLTILFFVVAIVLILVAIAVQFASGDV